MIENFDYKSFAQTMVKQANMLIPDDLSKENKTYIKQTMKNYALLVGEALSNDEAINLSQEQTTLIMQVLMEWTFHKCIDLCNSNIPSKYWDGIMQKIAFTIYEIAKQAISRNIPKEQLLEDVEYHVNKVSKEGAKELLDKNCITNEQYESFINNSNIDKIEKDETSKINECKNFTKITKFEQSYVIACVIVGFLLNFVLGIYLSFIHYQFSNTLLSYLSFYIFATLELLIGWIVYIFLKIRYVKKLQDDLANVKNEMKDLVNL